MVLDRTRSPSKSASRSPRLHSPSHTSHRLSQSRQDSYPPNANAPFCAWRLCKRALIGLLCLILFLILFALLFERQYNYFLFRYTAGPVNMVASVFSFGKVILLDCRLDIKGCAYNKFVEIWGYTHGWEEPGLHYQPGGMPTNTFTHAAFKRVAHDPKLRRPGHTFVLGNLTRMIEEGYFDPVISHTLRYSLKILGLWTDICSHEEPASSSTAADMATSMLNLATDDPERLLRRDLIAEAIVATEQHPVHGQIPSFEIPSFIDASAAATKQSISMLTGYNLFLQAFQIRLSKIEVELLEEWLDLMAACAAFGMCGDYSAAPRVHAITSHMVDRIERSRIGQSFYAKAVARGMIGEARLKELTVVVLFAGFGGTGGLLAHTLNYLQKNEQNTPMFKQCVQDADSVLLEGARLFPPVGGINPYVIAEDREITLGNGRKHFDRAGEYGSMNTNGANQDPSIFGGPQNSFAHAQKFIPGRENADRIVTWANELRDLRSCNTSAGCPAAPRPCPGAHLSYRLARDVLRHFCQVEVKLQEGSRQEFDRLDLNGDGVLDAGEMALQAAAQEKGASDVQSMDTSNDGVVDAAEFATAARQVMHPEQRDCGIAEWHTEDTCGMQRGVAATNVKEL